MYGRCGRHRAGSLIRPRFLTMLLWEHVLTVVSAVMCFSKCDLEMQIISRELQYVVP